MKKYKIYLLGTLFSVIIISCLQNPVNFQDQNSRTEFEKALDSGGDQLLYALESFINRYPTFEHALTLYLNICRNRDNLDSAGLFLKRIASEFPGAARIQAALGLIETYKNNKEKAIEYFRKSLSIAPSFFVYQGIIDTHLTAQNAFTAELLSTLENNTLTTENAMALGYYYDRQQQFDKSIEYWNTALSMNPDDESRLFLLMTLGKTYMTTGDFDASYQKLREALNLAKALGAVYDENTIYGKLGELFFNKAELDKALDFYNRELIYMKPRGFKEETAFLYFRIGVIYNIKEDFRKAYSYYLKTKETAYPNPDKLLMLKIHNSLGILYMNMKNFNKAEENFQKAIEYADSINDKLGKCIILTNLTQINVYKYNFNKALTIAKSAYTLAEELQYPMARLHLLHHFGHIYENIGDYEKVLKYAEEGEELAKSLGIETETGYFQLLTASAYIKMEKFEKAEALLSALLIWADERKLTEFLSLSFSEWGELYFAQEKYKEALSYLYKAIDKLEEYSAGSISIENRAHLLQYWNQYYEFTEIILATIYETTGDAQYYIQAFQISEQIRSRYLRESLKQAGISVEKNKDYTGTAQVSEQNILEEKLAGTNTVIFEYFLTRDRILLWVISEKGMQYYDTPLPNGEGENLPEAWKYALLSGNTVDTTGHKLYSLLLEKALADIQAGTTLCIIPHGELYGLAFEALPAPDRKFLIEKYPVCYSPSVAILNLLQKRNESIQQEWSKDILALGAPLLSSQNIKYPELPGSRKEVLDIGKIFSAGDILTGAEASESVLRKPGYLEQYRYLHIATHSIIDQVDSCFSGILLSEEPGKEFDGILTAGEISELKCRCELVTLSACRTSSGKIIEADGFSGFSYTWFSAGASSLLLSLWSIEDKFTSDFMIKFYSLLKEKGYNKVKALRETKIHFIDKGIKPWYWSSFILAGEAG